MMNAPLQDDLCAHRLLPESLCLLHDLLFALDRGTFCLKISEGLKHLPFFLAKIKKKTENKEENWVEKRLHWFSV